MAPVLTVRPTVRALLAYLDDTPMHRSRTQLMQGVAMYMRVTRARMDPARIDEVNSQVVPDLVATMRRLPGYQSDVAGVDRASGQAASVSTWDTEEHARYSPDALGDIPSRLEALGVQVDPAEFFGVTSA